MIRIGPKVRDAGTRVQGSALPSRGPSGLARRAKSGEVDERS